MERISSADRNVLSADNECRDSGLSAINKCIDKNNTFS